MIKIVEFEKAKKIIEKEKENPNFQILDVRTKQEFEEKHIKNSKNIDVLSKDFIQKIEKLNKNKTYLIYCRSGARSNMAIKIFKNKNFKNLIEIKNGIINQKI